MRSNPSPLCPIPNPSVQMMSQHYDSDRQAMRARLVEFRQVAPPSNITLTRMMPECRDERFRRTMELAFEGPRSSRTKIICDIASELPWHPTQELSSLDRFVSKVLIGVGIIAGLGLACYAVKRHYQASTASMSCSGGLDDPTPQILSSFQENPSFTIRRNLTV